LPQMGIEHQRAALARTASRRSGGTWRVQVIWRSVTAGTLTTPRDAGDSTSRLLAAHDRLQRLPDLEYLHLPPEAINDARARSFHE
jgi:hypothetical protein